VNLGEVMRPRQVKTLALSAGIVFSDGLFDVRLDETIWGRPFDQYVIAEDAERYIPGGVACAPHGLPDHETGWRAD